ncbi:hypothetical protein ABE26_20880 [Cytobacillus firmus]|nr:hypothetical protein [Cytobacillus firmus]
MIHYPDLLLFHSFLIINKVLLILKYQIVYLHMFFLNIKYFNVKKNFIWYNITNLKNVTFYLSNSELQNSLRISKYSANCYYQRKKWTKGEMLFEESRGWKYN